MTEAKSWQGAIDPTLLQRLLRPSVQPGCIDRRPSQAIISRYQRFNQRLPLLAHLRQRQNHLTGFQTDSLPIVYAQPVPSQTVIQTNVLVPVDQRQITERNQTINQFYKDQSSTQITPNQINQQIQPNLADLDLTPLNPAPIDQANANPGRAVLVQTNQTQTNQIQVNQNQAQTNQNQINQKAQNQSSQPITIQAKLTDSAASSPSDVTASDGLPVVTDEQPLQTVPPLQVEWLRSPNIPPAPVDQQSGVSTLPPSNLSFTQLPIVVAQPWTRSPVETTQNSPPVVVPVPLTPPLQSSHPNAARAGSQLADPTLNLPLVMVALSPVAANETGGRSQTLPTALPIIPVANGGRLPGQPGSSGSSGTGVANQGNVPQPLVFSVPAARAMPAQRSMEPRLGEMVHFMASTAENQTGVHAGAIPTMTHPVNAPAIGNGGVVHTSPQATAITVDQAKRLIADQTKQLVNVAALTDKIERQLMRRLSIEHERRGLTQR